MLKQYIYDFNGKPVSVIEAKTDLNESFQISILGDKYDTPTSVQYCGNFKDTSLEKLGHEKVALVNGGLFLKEGLLYFAVGLEKVMGIIHEFDDVSKDSVLALYHDEKMLYVASQKYVKANIGKYRGALTGAFGLKNGGLTDTSGRTENSTQFNVRSGRTIVGKKLDGTFVLACLKASTGSTQGITGLECVTLAKELNLTNAVCLDGGASVYQEFLGQKLIDTSRLVKNGVALYRKKLNNIQVGDSVELKQMTVLAIANDQALIKELNLWVNLDDIKKVAQ